MRKSIQVERSDDRPELPDATFKPSMLVGEQAVTRITWNHFLFPALVPLTS
jgi:hypothetical protein